MNRKPITVEIIAATRPVGLESHGLITALIEYPLYLHTELLTHRRFARNASSARAMSTSRYTGMGYYRPDTFYRQGEGMQASNIPIVNQFAARIVYDSTMKLTEYAAWLLEKLGVAKEQRNRLIPPTKIVRGIVTGTEDAWQYFLSLRANIEADKAMQELAYTIQKRISTIRWNYANTHAPFADSYDETDLASAVARIARVSYAREKGKDDLALARALQSAKHYSPFEHIAYWVPDPRMCAFNSVDTEDMYSCSGWESYRARI